MDNPDTQPHSFIIKVWREETGESDQIIWRGHITHVPGGQRRYFTNLGDIITFILAFLQTDDS